MILEVIMIVAGVTAVVSFLMALRLSPKSKKKEIAIEALSTIWTRHKNITLSIEELVNIWRDKNIQVVEQEKEVHYRHPEIQDLYERYLKGRTYSNSTAGNVIKRILTFLDEEGDCPSVVNTKGEPEGYIAQNTYEALSQVPLYKHSLNVAEHMIKAFKNSSAMLPKVLITALGHDLGKLPSARGGRLYSMGDHPIISVTILEEIAGYKELSFKDEINKAIMEHHRAAKGLLAEKLKEADHSARRMEMSEVSTGISPSKVEKQAEEKGSEKESSTEVVSVASQEKTVQDDIFARSDAQTDKDIFTPVIQSDEKSIPKEIPLDWFNADEFLKELKPYINRLWGERWTAFSMPDGYVYFQTGVIEEIAKKLGRNDPNVALMDTSRELKHSIMFTIVQRLKREKDAIARGLIKDSYFGGRFAVTMANGKTFDAYYTPFVAEAFGEKVSAFEILKQRKLKEIVKVEPLLQ